MLTKYVALFDAHYGTERVSGHLKTLHDPKMLAATLGFLSDFKPDNLIFGGDMLDGGAISHWKEGKRRQVEGVRLLKDCQGFVKDFIQPASATVTAKGSKHYITGNHECYDSNTEFLTQAGWKTIGQYVIGDQLLTYNRQSNELEWQKPAHVVQKHYTGPMLSANDNRVSFCVTPGHRIHSKNRAGNWETLTAAEAQKRERVVVPVAGKFAAPSGVLWSDDLISLAGWLLTDGHITSNGNYILYQNTAKVQPFLSALEREGITFTHTVRKPRITNFGLSKETSEVRISADFRGCVHSLLPTRDSLPTWVWDMTDAQFAVFRDALIYGDGTTIKSGTTAKVLYLKPNTQLQDELQSLFIQHNHSATITEYRPGQSRLNITERPMHITLGTSFKELQYDGDVWCFTVPNDSFFTRRNGKIVCLGNCWVDQYVDENPELEGIVDLDRLLELSPKGWRIIPQGGHVKLGHLYFIHGDQLGGGQYYSKKAVETYQRNIHFGHFHSHQTWTSIAALDHKPKQGVSIPCLCQRNPGYAHDHPNKWLQGFEYGFIESNGNFHSNVVIATDHAFMAEGHRYHG